MLSDGEAAARDERLPSPFQQDNACGRRRTSVDGSNLQRAPVSRRRQQTDRVVSRVAAAREGNQEATLAVVPCNVG